MAEALFQPTPVYLKYIGHGGQTGTAFKHSLPWYLGILLFEAIYAPLPPVEYCVEILAVFVAHLEPLKYYGKSC